MKNIPGFSNFSLNQKIGVFIGVWLVINLIQARFTELIDDEAYYWMYSGNLDWGFFDHPPMTALLIKLGYFIFPNELGVRLMFVLMGAGTLYMMWTLLPRSPRLLRLFILIIPAVVLMNFNVAGFISTPDPPLIFFSALFFVLYRNYLKHDKWHLIIALGLVITMMLYTKYHAVLLLGFTVLSHIKIIKRRSFWVIGCIALVLMIPHVIWQVKNDFPTLGYHLAGRNKFLELRQIPEYLLSQIMITGPFVGVLLLFVSFRYRPQTVFDRVLKFNLIGFFVFFLMANLKGHVEPHWTSMAFLPMLLLSIPVIAGKKNLTKWTLILSVATLPLLIVMRAYLMIDFLPLSGQIGKILHNKDVWASQMEELAGDRPVVFTNSYQNASLYNFYSSGLATSRNTLEYRKNQYDLWDFEEQMQGREVVYVPWGFKQSDTLDTALGPYPYRILNPYWSFTRVRIRTVQSEFIVKPGESFNIQCLLENPYKTTAAFQNTGPNKTHLYYSYSGPGVKPFKSIKVSNVPFLMPIAPYDTLNVDAVIIAPGIPGTYKMILSLGSDKMYPALNGNRLTVKVGG